MKRKNILITGASSGLGKGMALEFAKLGCNLALCSKRSDKLKDLKEEIKKIDPNVQVFLRDLDVNVHEDVFAVFQAFAQDFESIGGTLDRVIVNAGIGTGGSIGKGYTEPNRRTAETNFIGALTQFEAALEIFRKQNHGHLVAISSMSAFRGYGRALTVYAATKAALRSLAEGTRVDVMGKPIVISSIFPGYIESEMTDQLAKKPPFMIDLKKGSRLLVRAINREKANSYVPAWPWRFIKILMPYMSLRTLRKF